MNFRQSIAPFRILRPRSSDVGIILMGLVKFCLNMKIGMHIKKSRKPTTSEDFEWMMSGELHQNWYRINFACIFDA